jgi:hypothetical protein
LKWHQKKWYVRLDEDSHASSGQTLGELRTFLNGFEMGMEASKPQRQKGDICGGWGCDALECSCHGYDDEDDCGPEGCDDPNCDCHLDEDEDDMEDDPDADEGDDGEDIPF